LVYLVLWLPAWLLQMALLKVVLEPTYGLIRSALAVSCFFIGFAVAREQGLARQGTVLAMGTLVTSAIAIGQALPATREALVEPLSAVAPAFVPRTYASYHTRAFALFQAATTLSGFLAVVIPLMLAGRERSWNRGGFAAMAVAVIAGVAATATYSRQWLPALAGGFLLLAVVRPRLIPRLLAWCALTTVAVLALLAVGGLSSEVLADRFGRALQGPEERNFAIRLDRQAAFLQEIGARIDELTRVAVPQRSAEPTGSPGEAPGAIPSATPARAPTLTSTPEPLAIAAGVPTAAVPISAAGTPTPASALAATPSLPGTTTGMPPQPTPTVRPPTSVPTRPGTGTPTIVPAWVPTMLPTVTPTGPITRRGEQLRSGQLWQWLLGRGFALQDLVERGRVDSATAAYLRSGFTDNVFFLELRNHGLLAAAVYLALVGVALARGVTACRRPGPGLAPVATLTASLTAALLLHFFDNYFSESVFMKSGLWLLIGALVGCVSTRQAPVDTPCAEADPESR
jgi:hypothetical protein